MEGLIPPQSSSKWRKSNLIFWTVVVSVVVVSHFSLSTLANDADINAIGGEFEAAFQGKCGPSSPCVQLCVELHDGTFECQCRPGYRLLLDGYSCVELGNSTYVDEDEDGEDDLDEDDEEDDASDEFDADDEYLQQSSDRNTKLSKSSSLNRLTAAKNAALPQITTSTNSPPSSTDKRYSEVEEEEGWEGRPLPRPIASLSLPLKSNKQDVTSPEPKSTSDTLSPKHKKPVKGGDDAKALNAAAQAAEDQEKSKYLLKFAPIDVDPSSADATFDFFGLDPDLMAKVSAQPVGKSNRGGGEDYSDEEDEENEEDDSKSYSSEESDDGDDSSNEAEEDLTSLEEGHDVGASGTPSVKKKLSKLESRGLQFGKVALPFAAVIGRNGGEVKGDNSDESDDGAILPPRALPLLQSKQGIAEPPMRQSQAVTQATPATPPPPTAFPQIKIEADSVKSEAVPSASQGDPIIQDCPLKCGRGVCSKEGTDESNVGYRCLCPMGYKGPFCEIEEVFEEGKGYNSGLFRGKSWVAFPVLHDAYMADQISLEFRPQSPNGILLLTGERDDLSGDYLALLVRDGYLEFRFDCGSGSGVVRSSSSVKLEQWNKATIVRRRWDGWMQLNDGPFTQGRSKGLFSRITFRQPVYIGGQGNITFNSVPSIQSNFDDEPELISSSSTSSTTLNNNPQQKVKGMDDVAEFFASTTEAPLPSISPPTSQTLFAGPSAAPLSRNTVEKAMADKFKSATEKNLKNVGNENSADSNIHLNVAAPPASSSSSPIEVVAGGLNEEENGTVGVLKRVGGFFGCIRNLMINDRVYRFGLEPAGDSLQGFDIENCNDQGVCDLVKCQHGGQCIVQKDSVQCLCPLGFSGLLCETPLDLQIPSFNGSSYLKYGGLGLTRVLSWLELEIVIKPDGMDGLIMYNGYKTDGIGDFISLVIDQGYIEFSMDLGTGVAIIRSDSPIALGEWHHIHVSRTSRLISLRIDNQAPLMALTPGAFTQLSLPHNLFLGGIPDPEWLSPKVKVQGGFSGCIQRLVINEKPLRIMGSAMSGVNLENCEHPCLRNPCDHGGDCVPQLDTFKCHCPLGYRDPYCQTKMDKEDVITAPKFIGDSYLRFTHNRIIKRLSGWRLNLSFRIRTESSRGLLIWAGRKWMTSASDFITMGLRNGKAFASFSLGSGQITIAYNYTAVNDGRWHSVLFIRNEQEASLSVDDGPPVTGVAPGKLRQLNINDGLYVGGLEESRHQSINKYVEGFIGCLTDFVLGSERVALLQEASEGRNVDYCD